MDRRAITSSTGKRIEMAGVSCLVGMGIDISVRREAEAATEQHARRTLQATSHRLLTVQESERRSLHWPASFTMPSARTHRFEPQPHHH